VAAPAPEPPPAPRWRWLPTLVVVALTAAILTGAYVATRDTATAGHTGAAAFLPRDGSRVVTSSDGQVAVTENAILPSTVAAFSMPGKVNVQVVERHGDLVSQQVPMWRQMTTFYDGRTQQNSALFAVTHRGLEELAFASPKLVLTFDPALLVLPDQPHDGQHWVDRGDALGGLVDYRSATTIRRRGSCWVASGAVSFTSHATGQSLGDIPGDSTYCRGRGIVESTAVPHPPSLAGTGPDPAPLGDLGPLTAARTLPVVSTSSIGDLPLAALRYELAPVATGDGRLVLADANSRDLVSTRPDGTRLVIGWRSHPGGTITSLGVAGDVVLAGTSDRDLCAYDAAGAWRWCRQLGDIADLEPVPLGGGAVAVLGQDGVLRALDVRTGRVRWQVRGVDTALTPMRLGRRVVVVERDGTLRAWWSATGRPSWTTPSQDSPDAAVVSGDDVVLAGSMLSRYAADGHLVSQHVLRVSVRSVVAAGDVTVVTGGDGTVALDREGRRLWSDAPWSAATSDGTRLLAVRRSDVRRIDPATGRTEATWRVPAVVGTWWIQPLAGHPVLVHSGGTVEGLS